MDGKFPVESTVLTGNAFFGNSGYRLPRRPVFVDSTNLFHDPSSPREERKAMHRARPLTSTAWWCSTTELGFLFSGHRIDAEVLTPAGVIFKARDAAITSARRERS